MSKSKSLRIPSVLAIAMLTSVGAQALPPAPITKGPDRVGSDILVPAAKKCVLTGNGVLCVKGSGEKHDKLAQSFEELREQNKRLKKRTRRLEEEREVQEENLQARKDFAAEISKRSAQRKEVCRVTGKDCFVKLRRRPTR